MDPVAVYECMGILSLLVHPRAAAVQVRALLQRQKDRDTQGLN
jgi:hypothetical protein